MVFLHALLSLAFCLALAAGPASHAMQNSDSGLAQPQDVARLVVRKAERRLYLLDDRDNVMRSYGIMLGPNPVGHKMETGDGRTPEGRYIIDARNENSAYQRSLRISYPNAADKSRAKKAGVSPGGDIFIHGKPNGKSWMWWKYKEGKDWTEGCIAVSNDDMQEIWTLVGEGTEITIEP
jgi:murein L,D-transpeptidase YafK